MTTESQRQDLARRLVDREIYYCVSSLVSDLSTLVQEAGSSVGLSWEEDIYPLLENTDYETAGRDLIENCDDLEDLETMCDSVGYWTDAIDLTGWSEDAEYDEDDGEEPHAMGFSEWFEMEKEADSEVPALDGIRIYITDHVTDWQEFCSDNYVCTDDFRNEVYEHWLISNWIERKLKERGETTGELCGLTIWGRCTTGQSICLDRVIQEIALELWGDELLTSKEEV